MNKEKIKGILGWVIVGAFILGYFLIFYPAIVSVDSDGNAKCKSIIGLNVKC